MIKIITSLLLATLCTCAQLQHANPSFQNGITKLVYLYDDASVPPEYHRSYSITIESSQINVVVDSYGDILKDTVFPFDAKQFEKLAEVYQEAKLHYCETVKESDGCTGGNGEQIHSYSKESKLFSASVYHCGGIDYGNLCGNYESVKVKVHELVPNLKDLLE